MRPWRRVENSPRVERSENRQRAIATQAPGHYGRADGYSTMKVHEAIRLIEADGWFLVASDDLAPGTLNSILKQAGLKEQR